MADGIVEIANGKLRGKTCKTANGVQYYSFKGIPYAKPPVDELRFAAPVPAESWQGVRDATKECNICPQFDKLTRQTAGDEDCLYLNVYTPKLPTAASAPLPVMMFIHGGGFLYGNGTDEKIHGPDYLVEKDVVVVSINYRIGILGFLSLDLKEAPGNMGLKDQVLALKWIQQNISQFSGDKNNVTVFGISAGGASVEYLLLSPLSKGLFHKALSHSGSTVLHWAYSDDIKDLAFKIPKLKGKQITDEKALYDFLKSLSTKELVESSMAAIEHNTKNNMYFGFIPTLEKPKGWEPFLVERPYTLLKRGDFHNVPYVSGFTSHEGLSMPSFRPASFDLLIENKTFVDFMPYDFEEREKAELEKKLKVLYLDGIKGDAEDFAISYFTDVDFLGGVHVSSSLIAKKNKVYVFQFSYDGGLNYLKKKLALDRKGACHGDDGGYILASEILNSNDATDLLVRDRMVTMWTNFAKFGNPTPSTDKLITTKWEPIKEDDGAYLDISAQLTMGHKPHPERMKFYEELFEKLYGAK